MVDISELIREISNFDLTQAEIALRTGLTQPYISQLASGERGGRVTLSTYEALQSLLAELKSAELNKKQPRRASSHA